MSNEKDKGLDDLFKKKLEDPVDQIRYEEGDWDALEQMLDQQKRKRGIIYLLPILSGVAALFLLFLGWWLFKPQTTNNTSTTKLQATIIKQKTTPDTIGTKINNANTPEKNLQNGTAGKLPATANYAANSGSGNRTVAGKSASGKSPLSGSKTNLNNSPAAFKSNNTINNTSSAGLSEDSGTMLIASNAAPDFGNRKIAEGKLASVDLHVKAIKNLAIVSPDDEKTKVRSAKGFNPQYAITVLAAPDLNSVGSFAQSKVGTNIGLQFSAGVTKRFTVSAGALYSDKPYSANYGDYHISYQFRNDPLSVVADCRMIDIPINVGYQVYSQHRNKISLGTGLSSYIMLRENYTFNYATANSGPSNYNVPNSNKYFFGVLNLNATYDHQINSKVGIEVQPYYKLPITNIGYSQVRLQTTGVAVGLRWNLNSMSKP